jgi:cytochrome-b5 reductase
VAIFLTACCCLFGLYQFMSSTAPKLGTTFRKFPVLSRKVVNRGDRPVIFLTLGVSTKSLPTGAHVKVRAVVNGEEIQRSYTPTRFHSGQCELMFRVYPNGPMTTYLAGLQPGDAVEMRGPTGLERYGGKGPGTFSRGKQEWRGMTHIAMLSGGTGITPMLQMANHVLQDKADPTIMTLLAFTTTVADIMLQDTLQDLQAASSGRLDVKYICSKAAPEETGRNVLKGSMRELSGGALVDLLGVPTGEGTMVCICGPDGFTEQAKALCDQRFKNVLVW